jgi:hypothetical protein
VLTQLELEECLLFFGYQKKIFVLILLTCFNYLQHSRDMGVADSTYILSVFVLTGSFS